MSALYGLNFSNFLRAKGVLAIYYSVEELVINVCDEKARRGAAKKTYRVTERQTGKNRKAEQLLLKKRILSGFFEM